MKFWTVLRWFAALAFLALLLLGLLGPEEGRQVGRTESSRPSVFYR